MNFEFRVYSTAEILAATEAKLGYYKDSEHLWWVYNEECKLIANSNKEYIEVSKWKLITNGENKVGFKEIYNMEIQ